MTISRRDFLEAGAAGVSLLIGVTQSGCRPGSPGSPAGAAFTPSQWLRIDGAGRVTVINDKSEMGQGAGTAIPLIVAEELGVPWTAIAVEQARPGGRFDDMNTAGSDSVAGRWLPLRTAAAAAREMLVAAAAASWGVAPAQCSVKDGIVRHVDSRRELPFGRLVAAAAKLPVPEKPTLKSAKEFQLVGTRVPRLDARAAVTGAKRYGIDGSVPGMLRAVIARCPVPGGKVARWSGDRAKQVAGVRQVVPVPSGIAVVADTTWAAIKGREALEITWDEGAGKVVDSASLWRTLEGELAKGGIEARRDGNPDAALAGATRRLEAEYRYPFQAHAAVEPLNAVARVDANGCEIWLGTQDANRVQNGIAAQLGIPAERVVVNVLPLGGGFGRRIVSDFGFEAVEVARAAKVPIQLVWTREDDIGYDMFQSAAIVRMRAGLDSKGAVIGWSHQIADFHLSMFGDFDPSKFKPAEELEPWGGFDTPYAFPALGVRIARTSTPVRTGAWRSVFYPSSVFARECFLDEVAHAVGHDPVDFRLGLLDQPNPAVRRDNRPRLREVIRVAAERAGWSGPLHNSADGRRLGRGIACNEYHRSTVIATVAEVSVGPGGDVRVHRIVTAMDCGRPVNLDGIEAQIEGGTIWALSTLLGREITFAAGCVEQRNYDGFPVLRINQAPKIEAHVLPSDLPPFGVGEQPVPVVIPAVLNAVFAATGRRIRKVPLVDGGIGPT